MSDTGPVPATPGENASDIGGGSTGRVPFPVVGVGASAGGLEACQTLLRTLPSNLGMAYVFVPHMDPSRESAFREILARTTTMPVMEVADGTVVKPDHVYVIPRNCEMRMVRGVLHISHPEHARPVNTIIDTFFRSLAIDQGSNIIGIVLSGTASDGTLGLAAIKGEGGITFAQDVSAKYDGMPSSAIASGSVDLVLSPDAMARELARIASHPYVSGAGLELDSESGEIKDAQMGQLFAILRRVTRVDFSQYKRPTIGRRVARRMALHKLVGLGEYVALLQRDLSEVSALYQDLLINVTSFFRDPEVFDALKRIVYPELMRQAQKQSVPIRIWVPGCSSGEEPYSIAISVMEFLDEERAESPIQIFGTDLSSTAIERARTGLYKEAIEADVSAVRLRRYFHHVDSGYQVSKTIRDMCIFSTQNVFSDPPFSRVDLVSCRNVMIYLSQPLQRRVVPVFHYALNPHGFLLVGNAEGLLPSGAELFDLADKKQKIFRKKPVSTPVTVGFSVPMSRLSAEGAPPQVVPKAVESPRVSTDLQREADRLLLARYAPPSVVVNDNLEIVQIKGHTGPFLELPAGKVSLNLLKMARPGLLSELQSAIDEAGKSGIDAVRPAVPVDSNGGTVLTSLRVTPCRTPAQASISFLVTFEPSNAAAISTSTEAVISPLSEDERNLKDKQIAQLKQELGASKEYLQSIIEALESTNEELQSANEEIQSGNEELQSTNEELQTSKEELESANEELHTVNEEMQHRNEMLTQLNNDLVNLLNSINLPMVMVGPDLAVRRFTPQATRVLGLTATDVGRPISRLRLKLSVENLERAMLDVIADVRPSQLRVKDEAGQWCDLRLTPYRTADNRIDGVVLTVLIFEELEGTPKPQRSGEARTGAKKSAKKPARGPKKPKGKK